METIKQKDCRLNSTDSWIIGSFSLLGMCTGFFMPQTSTTTFIACLMIGAGLGLVISSIFSKNKQKNNRKQKQQFLKQSHEMSPEGSGRIPYYTFKNLQ